MPGLSLRWSVHESTKPYARPFMVTFLGDGDVALGSIALGGHDLLYHRQFRLAVAALSGELFLDGAIAAAPDPQRAWLERLGGLLPARQLRRVDPRSTFDHDRGRVFAFLAACDDGSTVVLDAPALHEYQEVQAHVAHQTGGLFRIPDVESLDEPEARRHAWDAWLAAHVERPGDGDALAPTWPWR
ncbi:MAG: hypothetical protein ACYDAC_08045 [Candidatus Dormibacteria bacterium]